MGGGIRRCHQQDAGSGAADQARLGGAVYALVEYQTGVLQAQRYVSVRQQEADAVAESILLQNNADIASFNATQLQATDAFASILGLFNGDVDKVLEYMKVRAMRDHPA